MQFLQIYIRFVVDLIYTGAIQVYIFVITVQQRDFIYFEFFTWVDVKIAVLTALYQRKERLFFNRLYWIKGLKLIETTYSCCLRHEVHFLCNCKDKELKNEDEQDMLFS